MNILEKALNLLINNKQFFAHFFLNSTIEFDNPKIPTAAVTMTHKGPHFYFSNKFLGDKTTEQVASIIEHEILHVVFRHIFDFSRNKAEANNMNIAMDCAINQYIEHLPEGCVTPESLEKILEKPLLREQTWEYYYSQIKQYVDSGGKNVSKMPSTLDEHMESDGKGANGEELTEDEKQALKDQYDAMVQDRVDQAIKQANGNVPQNILKIMEALRAKPQINWKNQLKNFMGKNISVIKKFSRKRPNRRFELDQPGKTKKRELTLGVCVDSSGSISDESYDKFMAEVMAASQACMKVYVIEADFIVQRVEVLTRQKKPALIRQGMGGTAYAPAITKALELQCDAIIYFGDFDRSDTPADPKVPFLWVGVGNQNPPAPFGSVLRLK